MNILVFSFIWATLVTPNHYTVAENIQKNLGIPNVTITIDKGNQCDPRGMGGMDKVIINTDCVNSLREFENLVTHELGHVVYQRLPEYMRDDWYAHPGTTVSEYAGWDRHEDFAETYNTYINHGQWFRDMAKKDASLQWKYDFIKGIVGTEYFGEKMGTQTFDSTLY